MKTKLSTILFSVLILTGINYPQFGIKNNLVKIKTFKSFDKVYPGSEIKLAVKAKIDDSWHINSNKPLNN